MREFKTILLTRKVPTLYILLIQSEATWQIKHLRISSEALMNTSKQNSGMTAEFMLGFLKHLDII